MVNTYRIMVHADNKLDQEFDEKLLYHVIHTDVTQVRLANHQWAY